MGLSEALVDSFIRLDMLTGMRERLPITPDEARQLIERGVSQPTLGLMLKNEIASAKRSPAPAGKGQPPLPQEETTPPLEGKTEVLTETTPPVKEEPAARAEQAPEAAPEQPPGLEKAPGDVEAGKAKAGEEHRPGREVVLDADGRKMIVYRSGDTRGLERRIEVDADGRRHIVYRSGDPTAPVPSMSEREREQLEQAYELLRRIQLQVDITR